MLIRFDERRNLAVLENREAALQFAVDHWIQTGKLAIQTRGRFLVALSGGSTPQALYERLGSLPNALDWSKVFLFWSDERCVPPDHPDSNYNSAMKAGLARLPISQIFRMEGELEPNDAAQRYQILLETHLDPHRFDLVMLGVGEDGHTASLFPDTGALALQKPLVAANTLADGATKRLTLTFSCINQSRLATLYTFGSAKAAIVHKVLTTNAYPASLIGTPKRPALWILDQEATSQLSLSNQKLTR